ncbi:fumarylacetoacetate hydrolase family protein [Halovivax limisalsi]|uniref:fumarylacetoacetate hydrolase family protein n=1 Tax=Halovivax limisalsi TaxID=1453760 RepID=UPI001FFD92DB|nr:fumarylacetoacetate hydrolase family protein [Halovivax limisalsi]
MRRLARAADGAYYVGDETGFVPLSSADPRHSDETDALAAAADGLPDPTAAPHDRIPADQLSLSAPVSGSGTLWGIGLNYVDHADDLDATYPDEPASFCKPGTTLTGPGGPIRLPPTDRTERVTGEAELAVVIGRRCRNVAEDEVDDVIAGYVPAIDMTAEDILQRNPRYLTRAKSFDTFLVLGPWLRTDPIDLDDVTVETVVNDEVRASNSVSNMAFPPRELVAYHSRVMTLEPGDVISTGTPGAHPLSPGDRVRAAVDGVGTLTADVVRDGTQ